MMDRVRSALYTTAEAVRGELNGSPSFNSSAAGQPLQAALAKLRVVDLETGRVRSLRPGERYACISHEWSKHLPGEDVTTEIREQVREDVDAVIKRYGRYGLSPPTAIWLDTVCIDQDNDSDKAYWVPRMGDVYSHAICTYPILSRVDILKDITPMVDRHPCRNWSIAHDCTTSRCSEGHDLSDQELQILLAALEKVMQHGWRERIWIAQETVLSKTICFLNGSGSVDLREMRKLCALLMYEDARFHWDTWVLRCEKWFYDRLLMHKLYSVDALGAALVLKSTETMKATVPSCLY